MTFTNTRPVRSFCRPASLTAITLLLILPVIASAQDADEPLPVFHSRYGTFKLGKKPYPAGTRDAWIAEGRVLAAAPEGYFPRSTTLKGAAYNKAYLPPIGNQGSEGSCVHWAGTYYVKTATMKRMNPALNVTATSNQCSPRFTYNLTNCGEDNGGYGHEPFEIFQRYGVASLAQKPYSAGSYVTLPTTTDFIEGLHRRSTNYVWVWDWNPTTTEINELKAYLDAGGVAACAVYAESTFDAWNSGDSPWVGATCDSSDLNHMVTVCGYGSGWYLIANSWGTSFGSNGFIYVDSDYFENYVGDVMYPLEGVYTPATNYAKLNVTHARRSDLQELVLTVNGSTVWNNSPLPKNLPKGTGSFDTDTRANLNVAIDLSLVSWGAANVVTGRVADRVSGTTGSITNFSVRYNGTEYFCATTPVTVPDNTSYGYAPVQLSTPEPTTNVCFDGSAASVSEGSGSYTVRVFKTLASGNISGQIALSGTAQGGGTDYTFATSTNFTLNGSVTSTTFVVNLTDNGSEDGNRTLVMTLANVTGGTLVAPTAFTLTIQDNDSTGGGTETFANFTPTASTYVSGTFAGQDGSTWTYTKCRGDIIITDETPCMGRDQSPAGEILSGTIVGGCGTLTFDWMKAFTTDVNLEVYVNGSLVGRALGGTTSVAMSTSITVNVTGDVVFRFLQPSGAGQVAIDNVTWTGYGSGGGLPAYYTNWANGYSLDPYGANGGMDDDYDDDGYSNIDEYISGSDPTEEDSVFAITDRDSLDASRRSLTIDGLTGRVYTIYYRTNLIDSSPWTTYTAYTNIATGQRAFILTNTAPEQMYRIGVRVP